MTIMYKIKYLIGVICITLFISACKKYAQITPPPGSIDARLVYDDNASATAGILSLYSLFDYRDVVLYSAEYGGLSADELNYFGAPFSGYLDFQSNSLTPEPPASPTVIWGGAYQQILNANIAIDGLQKSTKVTPALKSQLIGEAKFWRAHAFFMLVNCYGAVPLTLSTDATVNAVLPRAPIDQVYGQIISDLKEAKDLLSPTYPTAERARVNQFAVSALLARVYLYNKDWIGAENESTNVISSGVYSLSSPDETFLNTSNETILQIYTLEGFTQWGTDFVPPSPADYTLFLRPGFENSFEANDKRFTNWVAPIGTTGNYSVNKYKLINATAGNEYYIVLRLAEQYLIRAEARAHQQNLSGAASDINVVRTRAGLAGTTAATSSKLLAAVEQERKIELFAEYPHRWFDLKRTPSLTDPTKTRADDVLAPIKPGWKSTAVLYPISSDDIIANPNLTQNPGY
ncbi:RagB/SusD family nutrient uptake outer membrane protein [Mucilaginibacter sp. KACC 22773]|uniref:RagB/SusD family nutrient uptake outer membrane protein n=1 Tax=Mucilaginibacter sp. KACC 22773 TaxID=3025671 RepID=UPI002365C977|nr:RagB/SusD family nutrient uptake outer membrane protein [Mucilaginibacter sp. KACC 22773]WDF77188.1 RagB/SusD family nutrient uptake outer membrane protein [Mucilaginibacter sp. KACC 22773]